VANHSEAPGDRSSSLGWKLADETGGAVPPQAAAQVCRAASLEKVFPNRIACPVQLVRRQRLSRLCVLMNPCPAGRAVHLDLAGEKTSKKPAPAGRTIPGGRKR
jgi:hypothetical protein